MKGDPSRPWPGKCGYAVDRVLVDDRYTLYSRYGDWFAWGCAILLAVIYLDYSLVRATARGED